MHLCVRKSILCPTQFHFRVYVYVVASCAQHNSMVAELCSATCWPWGHLRCCLPCWTSPLQGDNQRNDSPRLGEHPSGVACVPSQGFMQPIIRKHRRGKQANTSCVKCCVCCLCFAILVLRKEQRHWGIGMFHMSITCSFSFSPSTSTFEN